MKTVLPLDDGSEEVLSTGTTGPDGSASVTVDVTGAEVRVSDEARLVHGRQTFSYSTGSRTYVLNADPVFALILRLAGDGVDGSVSGQVEIFEGPEGGVSVFGPQDFCGESVVLSNLTLVGFQLYRVVVRASGY